MSDLKTLTDFIMNQPIEKKNKFSKLMDLDQGLLNLCYYYNGELQLDTTELIEAHNKIKLWLNKQEISNGM